MDELRFRRQAYGEPDSTDPEFLSAMDEDPDRLNFINDLKQLDLKLESSLRVDVPEGLAEKLILRQQLTHHHNRRRTGSFFLAMAASVAIVAGVSLTMWQMGPVDLGQNAIGHVQHETAALLTDQGVNTSDINTHLASFRGLENNSFSGNLGKIYYISHCHFQGIDSMHIVMQGQHGKVTVFIVPRQDRMQLEQHFADNNLIGMGFETQNTYMLVVGNDNTDVSGVKNEIMNKFI